MSIEKRTPRETIPGRNDAQRTAKQQTAANDLDIQRSRAAHIKQVRERRSKW